jgi:hypothetical protein
MGYSLRTMPAERKFCSELTLEALSQAIPPEAITAVLAAESAQEQRERKLTMDVVMLVLIAMNLYPDRAIDDVLRKLAQGLRFIWPDPDYDLPTAGALTYRRYQLGARPMVALFHQLCHPIATSQTTGAFLFGLRLVALDGTVEDVPDTPANAAAFGRHSSDRGASAFPQVQCVYLAECGTHCVFDAGLWPCHTSERIGGHRLLRSVRAGMLVMWDRGFHDFDMIVGVVQRDGHVLSRLPAHVKPRHVRTLPDGSSLAWLTPSDYQRHKQGERVLVRIIPYTITEPTLPGYGETHRLVTTLLDPDLYPAVELICAYHERWEIEVLIDEMDTHQRLAIGVLRSRKPVGVVQELYGLLMAHYAIRVVMHEAALQAEMDPDRLSFVHAVRVIQDALPEFQMSAEEHLPQLYQRLLRDIRRKRVPERRLRVNPRVVKRKMSKFKLKRPEHAHPPTLDRPFREVVAVQRAIGNEVLKAVQPTDDKLVLFLPPSERAREVASIELRHREPCRI